MRGRREDASNVNINYFNDCYCSGRRGRRRQERDVLILTSIIGKIGRVVRTKARDLRD
jgi:hypothetical protein